MAKNSSLHFGAIKNLALGSFIVTGVVFGLSPEQKNLKVYYGLLHAHTLISDGSGTPEEAFQMAMDNGLDFFAVTPHNHAQAESGAKERRDNVLIANNKLLYNGNSIQSVTRTWKEDNTLKSENLSIKPLIMAAQEINSPSFLAIYGQEFSTISAGNHVNVFGVDEVITTLNGDFNGLISFINDRINEDAAIPIIQLNHPDKYLDLFYGGSQSSTINKMFNDYGVDPGDLGPHFKDVAQSLNPFVCLIELLSGPAMKQERIDRYKYHDNENDYYFYLKQGFHISPSVGQDNHYKTWGITTDARMGIIAETLTQESIFSSIRQCRTFASEDKNMQAIFYVNDQLMGSSIVANSETELKINVLISDADEPKSVYKIVIHGGEVNSELSTKATNWNARDGEMDEVEANGDGTYAINGIYATNKPFFLYIKVIQEDGDKLWTAPVWINSSVIPERLVLEASHPLYYWTKSNASKVYHKSGCVSINRIHQENLMLGESPPSGRSLHNCTIEEVIGH